MSRYVVNDKGERKAKASPELLPDHLRVLPGDLVTKEVEIEDRIHAADPPHIVKALASDYIDKAQGKKPHDPHAEPDGPGIEPDLRVTQEAVDIRRLSVLRRWATTQKERIVNHVPSDVSIKHLCFPDLKNHGDYSMHAGNHSACLERVRIDGREKWCKDVKHLRNLRLEIDLMADLPETIVAKLRDRGVNISTAYERLIRKQMNLNQVVTPGGEPWI